MAIVLRGAGGGAACKSANLHEQQFCMSSAAHSRLQPTHQRRQVPAFICTAQPSGAPASSQQPAQHEYSSWKVLQQSFESFLIFWDNFFYDWGNLGTIKHFKLKIWHMNWKVSELWVFISAQNSRQNDNPSSATPRHVTGQWTWTQLRCDVVMLILASRQLAPVSLFQFSFYGL